MGSGQPGGDTPMSAPERRVLLEEGCADIELWLELVKARMDAGVTPEHLASQTGIPLMQVMRIEQGKIVSVPLSFLRQYAHYVGRTMKAVVQRAEIVPLRTEQGEPRREKKAA